MKTIKEKKQFKKGFIIGIILMLILDLIYLGINYIYYYYG